MIEDEIAEGDKVVTRFTWSATNTGDTNDFHATGKRVRITGIAIARFENGKLAERWGNYDGLSMMRQLGLVSSPEQGRG